MRAIVTGEFTILILQKYGFKVYMISFGFYSTNFKVYIHLPCISTQQQTTAPFDDTPVILSSDHQKTGLYQGSADCCEGYHNLDIIRLLQQSQTIHYCNQSVLAIVPDLTRLVFSISIIDLISRSTMIGSSLLCARYFYNLTGLRFYIFVFNQHHVFLIAIVMGEFTILILQKYGFKVHMRSFGF